MAALIVTRTGVGRWLARSAVTLAQVWRLSRGLAKAGMLRRLGGAYARAWTTLNRPLGRERLALPVFVGLCVVHWHFYNVANRPRKGEFGIVAPTRAPTGEMIGAARATLGGPP